MRLEKQLYITDASTLHSAVTPVQSGKMSLLTKKPEPGTGFWTSTWREETQDSGWVDWCRQANDFDALYEKNWFLLAPKENVNLYIIDHLKDLAILLRDYGSPNPPLKVMGIERYLLNFERLSLCYDGIWLTEQGNRETHCSFPEDLNAWDCESILWFRWCFTEVQRIAMPEPVMIEE